MILASKGPESMIKISAEVVDECLQHSSKLPSAL